MHPFKRAVDIGAEEINQTASDDDQGREAVAYFGDQVTQTVELLVERGLDAVVNLCRLKNFSVFCGVSDGINFHDAVAFHNLCASHHVV